jgi:hypothetical protein
MQNFTDDSQQPTEQLAFTSQVVLVDSALRWSSAPTATSTLYRVELVAGAQTTVQRQWTLPDDVLSRLAQQSQSPDTALVQLRAISAWDTTVNRAMVQVRDKKGVEGEGITRFPPCHRRPSRRSNCSLNAS